MTDWSAVIPPPAVATAMMRVAQPAPAKRVVAAANSGDIGNDAQNRHPPPDPHLRHPVVVPPRPDTDRPTGPPPAFEANVLEAEAQRRRLQPAEDKAQPIATSSDTVETEVRAAPEKSAETADAMPDLTGSKRSGGGYYSAIPTAAEPQLDLIR